MDKDIYSFIESRQAQFTNDIDINGWSWNFKQHIKTSFFYKHGRLLNGNDENTPVKNITRPLLNLQYRAEDIDVKDIVLYVDDPNYYHLSFLVKKYHDDVFVVENDIDTFLDELKESKIDYGVGIAKKMKGARPDIAPLEAIAFCDQTDILAGPIAFMYNYAPDELKEMESIGWGDKANGANISIDELITLSQSQKSQSQEEAIDNKTPGTYIEIYEVHGNLPRAFLDDGEEYTKYDYQLQIVGFYKNQEGKKQGVTLFRKKQQKGNLKVVLRDKIYGRCAGFGGAEELFENQVWTTYDVIRMKDLLDSTSKIILQTTDSTLAAKHPGGLKNLSNLEVLELQENTTLSQVDTTPRSMVLFEKSVNEWESHAQKMSGATDALLGQNPTSGTPFKLQDLVVQEGKGLHDYRRGKYAKFIEEVYRDWIIPEIQARITSGSEFLSELSMDEMKYVTDCLVRNELAKAQNELVLSGKLPMDEQEQEAYKQKIAADFSKGGNKKFIKILKGELNKKPLRVKINVAGKQKDFARMTDRIVNIFRQILSNPDAFQKVLQIPGMANNFNQILEYSGMSPVAYAGLSYQPPVSQEPQLQENKTLALTQ